MKVKIKLFLTFLIFSTFILSSCKNALEEAGQENDSSRYYDFTGIISENGAYPSYYASRMALPVAYDSTNPDRFYYMCSATHGETVIEGQVTGTTFTIPGLEFDVEYTIKVWLEDGLINDAEGKILMMDSKSNVKISDQNPTFNYVFAPKPVVSEGTGNIELTIDVEYIGSLADDDLIRTDKLVITCESNSDLNDSQTLSTMGDTVDYIRNAVPAGNYEVLFQFLNTADDDDDVDVVLYSELHTISVCKNMTTNTWHSDDTSNTAVDSSGTFKLTNNLIKQNSNECIYVGNTGLGTAPATKDDGDGYLYSPFHNLNQAIKYIKATGSTTKNYQINICGTQTGNFKFSGNDINTKAASILLQKSPTQTENAVINGSTGSNSVLVFSSAPKTTIKGITITGGNNTGTKSGGGITLSNTELTLDEDTRIENNYAETKAGGIWVASASAVLNIKSNVYIYNNTAGTLNAANNLYIERNDTVVNILGPLKKGNQNARIGITKVGTPSVENPIIFTSNYGYNRGLNNKVKPGRYFRGDQYGVTYNADGEAILTQSGGNVTIDDFYEDVSFSIDKTTVFKALQQKTFTFTAKGKDEDDNWVTIPSNQITWAYTVLVHGETIPADGGYYTSGTGSNTNQLSFTNSLPKGTYTIVVRGTYEDRTYSAEFTVKVIEAFTIQDSSGTTLADKMMDASVTLLRVCFVNDYTTLVPELDDAEKVSSGYYSYEDDVYYSNYSCIVPQGKTLELLADTPVTLSSNATYRFFKVKGTLIIGENITITGEGLHHYLFDIEDGGKLILNGGTFTDGIGLGTNVTGSIEISNGGTFIMNSGLITRMAYVSAVQVRNGGTFEMHGGEISGNNGGRWGNNNFGGAVTVHSGGTFIKDGGIIKNNTRNEGTEPSQVYFKAGARVKYNDSSLNTITTAYNEPNDY